MRNFSTLCALVCFVLSMNAQTVTGELKRWHKVTVTFDGPNTSESANPNPFLDYRLEVTFTKGGLSYKVPGYFSGCNNPADSGCTSGNKWKVHFSPGETGKWNWKASFKKGSNAAINGGGSGAGFMDNKLGSFDIAESNKSGRDHRAKDKGMLQYVGEHYLRYSGTSPSNPNGNWFVKAGADSPENALNYVDFDATPSYNNGVNKLGNKTWQPHQQDYNASDASAYTWDGGKGTEILGMINYLSSQGANVLSFLTWNTSGDGGAVFPHTLQISESAYGNTARKDQWGKVNKTRFDVSKLAQWEKVMEYADKKGMYLHFKTMETENDNLMDNNNFGNQRKVYYRELIARFGHHLALNWNLTEETTIPDAVVKSTASYIKNVDPYDHNIVIHTYPKEKDKRYTPLLGNKSVLTGASLQIDKKNVHKEVKEWIDKSRNNGKKWVVANDEQGDADEGIRVSDKRVRNEVLWGTLMAGGAGVEYYSGYTDNDGDLNGNDHRKRGGKYRDGGNALAFFNNYLQSYMVNMVSSDGVTSDGNDYVFAKAGEVYTVYRPNGGSTNINVQGSNNTYKVQWYNPRAGGSLTNAQTLGSSIKAPDNNDWVALITKNGATNPDPNPGNCATITFDATSDFSTNVSGFSPAYLDTGRDAMAINAEVYKNKFAAGETTFNGNSGKYNIRLNTLTEVDGESQYRISINGNQVGTYKNPTTNTDYTSAGKTFNNIEIQKGQKIRVEFNSVTNGKISEGSGTAFSRGRWTSIQLSCSGSTPSPTPTPTGDCVAVEKDGVVAVEAESFFEQTKTSVREWYIIGDGSSRPSKDPDTHNPSGASGKKYIEILPDTRVYGDNDVKPEDKLINGENFSNTPGQMAIVKYKVRFSSAGKYFVWVRTNFSGKEDNGVHVGIDGTWPSSGQRMQWCGQRNVWVWESKQRREPSSNHCGVAGSGGGIYLNVPSAGIHTIEFSMREDGFEMDKFVLSKAYAKPSGAGPAQVLENCGGGGGNPTPAPSGGPAGYTYSTDEGGTVNVSGTVNIAYGANGKFSFLKNVSSNTPCNNGTFGDPISGVKKSCYIQKVSAPTPAPSGGPAGYTYSTDEGGTVNVSGTVNIAYGANGQFEIVKNVTSNRGCNNANFGDPIPGVKKACYIQQVSTTNPTTTPAPTPSTDNCSFGAPTSGGLPSLDKADYSNVFVLGDGPNLSNLKRFRISWNAGTKKVTQFAFNTRNGNPSYYVDLRGNITHNFGGSKPSVSISGSGIGIDGDYWVTKRGNDFAMVSKGGKFTIYCSTSSSNPGCVGQKASEQKIAITLYPNPASDQITISGIEKVQQVVIYDMLGKRVKSLNNTDGVNNQQINVSDFPSGMYFVRAVNFEAIDQTTMKFFVK